MSERVSVSRALDRIKSSKARGLKLEAIGWYAAIPSRRDRLLPEDLETIGRKVAKQLWEAGLIRPTTRMRFVAVPKGVQP